MHRNPLFVLIAILIVATASPAFGQESEAPIVRPAPAPIADPSDKRFVGVKEDWNNPGVVTSSLRMAHPLSAGVDRTHSGYTVELLQVQWRWGDPIDLYILKPTGLLRPPVIVYLYGYPSDTAQFRNPAWQDAVTKDGFAAVGFVTALTGHRYHDRPMKEWFLSDLQESLAVSAHDLQMVLNYLATRDDFDLDRVGVLADGSSASIAILASAADDRIKVLDVLDPWGDWPTWLAESPFVPTNERTDYVKPEFLKNVAGLDPVNWLPKIQAKKLRLQDAIFDTDTPEAAQAKLRAAVPPGAKVVIYKDLKEYRMAINGNKVMDWIHDQLRALPGPLQSSSTVLATKPDEKKTENSEER